MVGKARVIEVLVDPKSFGRALEFKRQPAIGYHCVVLAPPEMAGEKINISLRPGESEWDPDSDKGDIIAFETNR